MQTIIGVRFKKVGKIYFFSPAGVEVKVHDRVVVETRRGTECGTVVLGPRELEERARNFCLSFVWRQRKTCGASRKIKRVLPRRFTSAKNASRRMGSR